jgi:SpoIID/LytB domain protein
VTTRRTALALLGMIAGLLATPTPAQAEITVSETFGISPAVTYFKVEGHGWGHGRGLSQFGAQGAAKLSKTADQITSFYYPGTARSPLSGTSTTNPTIRVRLEADKDNSTEVFPATGLVVTDLGSGAKTTLPTSSAITRWRTKVAAAGFTLQKLESGTWKTVSVSGRTALTGPVQFSGPTFVRVQFPKTSDSSSPYSRDYRGKVRAVRIGDTSAMTQDVLPMESYLLGVVPRESLSGWPAATLQAQAIAARSYSRYKIDHAPASRGYDICDTTQCQVFGGSAVYTASGTKTVLEPSSTTSAVQATKGVVRTYDGKPIFAEFSSSNGGWSTTGSFSYLKAQRDDWDGVTGSSVHAWTAKMPVQSLVDRYFPGGSLKKITVVRRDGNGEWGGRVKEVKLEGVTSAGQAATVTASGAGFYYARTWPAYSDGLRSSWWRLLPSTNSSVASKSAVPPLVQSPGTRSGEVTATLTNTGTTTWSTSGLHLALVSPAGGAEALTGGTSRPGVYTGSASSIAAGETATFRISLDADKISPGSYLRSYRLRSGSGSLFGATVAWRFNVAAAVLTGALTGPPAGAAGSGDAPGAVLADGRSVVVPVAGSTPLTVSVRNTGNVTWPVNGPVQLGTSGPRGHQSTAAGAEWLAANRPSAAQDGAPVAPGQPASFALRLYGNNRAVGVTSEAFEPLWYTQGWIGGAALPLRVVRVNPAVDRSAVVDLRPASTITLKNAPTGKALLRIRLRNTGGSAWPVGTEKLSANATPLASGWPSSTQAPPLAVNVTRPGVGAVYPGEVGEWRVPLSAYKKADGSYAINLRAQGPAGAYGPTVGLTVKVVKATFTGSVVRVSGTVKVPRTGKAVATFDVKNTGNVAWPVGGAVRSGSLTKGGSPSRASSWLSPSRPGPIWFNVTKPGATSIAPGQVARFKVVLAGNSRSLGTRSEAFDVVWETYRWMGLRITLRYTIV